MSFVLIVNDLKTNLNSDLYVKHLWNEINDDNSADDDSVDEENLDLIKLETDYKNHLPVDYQSFLNNLLYKIQEMHKESSNPDWAYMDQIYFNTLLYYTLKRNDGIRIYESLTAIRIFFVINSFQKDDLQDTYHEKIFNLALNVLEYVKNQDCKDGIFPILFSEMNIFIDSNNFSMDIFEATVSVLFDIAVQKIDIVFTKFPIRPEFRNYSHGAFCCLKLLLLKNNHEDNIMFFIIYFLKEYQELRNKNRYSISLENVEAFIVDIEEHIKDYLILILQSLDQIKNINEYSGLLKILTKLDFEIYIKYCNWIKDTILNKTIDNIFKEIGIEIIKYPHSSQTFEKRDTFIELLIINYFKLLYSHDNDLLYSCQCIEKILNIHDETVSKAINSILSRDISNEIQLYSLLNILHKLVDLLWRKKESNICYINIICKLSLLKPHILFMGAILNNLEKLCIKAWAVDLKDCAGNLYDVMIKNYNQPQVVETILKIFIHFALTPISVSSFYLKLLQATILQPILNNHSLEIALEIANILISETFNFRELFKKFYTYNYIRPELFKMLLEKENVHVKSWKLLESLCDASGSLPIKYLPTLSNELTNMLNSSEYQNINYLTRMFYKILKPKVPLVVADIERLEVLQIEIERKVMKREIPLTSISNVLIFLKCTHLYSTRGLWAYNMLTRFENRVAENFLNILRTSEIIIPIFQRNVIYLAYMSLVFNLVPSQEFINTLKLILKRDYSNEHDRPHIKYLHKYPQILTSCLILFNIICIKDDNLLKDADAENIFAFVFKSPNNMVNVHAIACFNDLSATHLDSYNQLVALVFELLNTCDLYCMIRCVKVIENLVSKDCIRLTEGQHLKFISLIAQDNYEITSMLKEILRTTFIHKSQNTITKYFVKSIVYYNKYKNHPHYMFSNEEKLYSTSISLSLGKRYCIYKFMFNYLPKQKQFNILEEINEEIFKYEVDGILKVPWDVFLDCLSIFFIFTHSHHNFNINNRKEFYNKCIKDIQNIISEKATPVLSDTAFPEYHNKIEKYLKYLLDLPNCILATYGDLFESVIEVVLFVTQCFLKDIKYMIHNGNMALSNQLVAFTHFFNKNEERLSYLSDFEFYLTCEDFPVNDSLLSTSINN